MYICPTCEKKYKTEETIKKHFLTCWKEQHPFHQSTPAPRGADVVTKEVNEDIVSFFNSFN